MFQRYMFQQIFYGSFLLCTIKAPCTYELHNNNQYRNVYIDVLYVYVYTVVGCMDMQ